MQLQLKRKKEKHGDNTFNSRAVVILNTLGKMVKNLKRPEWQPLFPSNKQSAAENEKKSGPDAGTSTSSNAPSPPT